MLWPEQEESNVNNRQYHGKRQTSHDLAIGLCKGDNRISICEREDALFGLCGILNSNQLCQNLGRTIIWPHPFHSILWTELPE